MQFNGPNAPGRANPKHALGVIRSIEMAVEFAKSGQASSVCTNPINKKALKDGAAFQYPGHTEFLAALGGNCDVVMMLASDKLRVVPATIEFWQGRPSRLHDRFLYSRDEERDWRIERLAP